MIERVEMNNDLARSEPIREVRHTKKGSTGEATKKQFVAELDRKIAEEKKKKKRKNEKDEIILHKDEEEEETAAEDENDELEEDDEKDKTNGQQTSPPDNIKGKSVDFLA